MTRTARDSGTPRFVGYRAGGSLTAKGKRAVKTLRWAVQGRNPPLRTREGYAMMLYLQRLAFAGTLLNALALGCPALAQTSGGILKMFSPDSRRKRFWFSD